jgi:hypothetical protein
VDDAQEEEEEAAMTCEMKRDAAGRRGEASGSGGMAREAGWWSKVIRLKRIYNF